MGDLNARVGPSDMHLKAVGRYTYHHNDNGRRLTDLCEANNMRIATTRKPHPNRQKWSGQYPNGSKTQLDHVILRRKWINSLQNCRCYNTVEIDSDHCIVTANLKFSLRTNKKKPRTFQCTIRKLSHQMMLLRNKFQLELFNGLRTYKLMKMTLYKLPVTS